MGPVLLYPKLGVNGCEIMLWMNKIHKKRIRLEGKISIKMEIIIYTSSIYSVFFVELILARRYLKQTHKRGEKGNKFFIITPKFNFKNLNNVGSLNINQKARLRLIFIRNKIVNARVMYQGGAFAKCLYLVGYPNSLLLFH
jgi:hypothetical protein